jgi:hypothetical protein
LAAAAQISNPHIPNDFYSATVPPNAPSSATLRQAPASDNFDNAILELGTEHIMLSERLRVEPHHAPFINDYRIHDGQVEVRTLDPVGHPFDLALSGWKALDDNELQLHFALRTVVAKWLQDREPDLCNRATPGYM